MVWSSVFSVDKVLVELKQTYQRTTALGWLKVDNSSLSLVGMTWMGQGDFENILNIDSIWQHDAMSMSEEDQGLRTLRGPRK
jgi:hypothetical protein